jgi:cellulose synthase/poly-beta-1,6-N-acetylglucosamine synthase-like glycosyltransferase
MDLTQHVLATGFWSCVIGVTYAYVGYPAIVSIVSRLFGRDPTPSVQGDDEPPRVALLIAAHNEADVIESRIEDALALAYPRNRLQIVIASDGSDDGTVEICRRYGDRITLLAFPQRRGKAAVLNDAVARLDADVVVLSDANTFMDPAALHHLVRWFRDPAVGVVCGRLVLTDPRSGRNVDSLYWRYETHLKRCEARLDALLGANGAIYAIRRALFPALPPGTAVDDFVVPLLAKLRTGCRVLYENDAVAREESAPELRGEFRRRARIGAGGFQALGALWPLLQPRHGWTAFAFWSHKVLRWVCPFLMLGALLTGMALASHPLYRRMNISQGIFYGLCAAGAVLPAADRRYRFLRMLSMFAAMNLALLVGFFRWLRGTQTGHWQRTSRAVECVPSTAL